MHTSGKQAKKIVESKNFGEIPNNNLMIHGDCLVGLEFLCTNHKGRIKCIYIDPPYNSQNEFEHYSDKYTEDEWYTLMFNTLSLLKELLSDDGTIFLQIDNKELHYLKVLADSVFGRENYLNSFIIKKNHIKWHLETPESIKQATETYSTILLYKKSESLVLQPYLKQSFYTKSGSWINFLKYDSNSKYTYDFCGILPRVGGWRFDEKTAKIAIKNYKILQTKNKISFDSISIDQCKFDQVYINYINKIQVSAEDFPVIKKINGNILLYQPPLHYSLTDNWLDLDVTGYVTNFEHEVNELLLHRIFDWVTNENDTILDCFAGSGTSASVAHKMSRNWISIEKGHHCITHCLTRLIEVIEKKNDLSPDESLAFSNWKGGGGFKFIKIV